VLAAWAVGLLVAAVALAALAPLLARPDHVDAVQVRNPHEWHATVAVSSPGVGWVGLGRVTRESDRSFHEVLDQGDRWTFRFTYGDVEATTDVTRSDLEAAGWSIDVPGALGEAARAEGVQPSDADG
jgi:hypothetical protein